MCFTLTCKALQFFRLTHKRFHFVRSVKILNFVLMKRHFNTHIEGLDLNFWHDLIESRGTLVTLQAGECLCRKGEPTNKFGYVKSGYLKYGITELNNRELLGGFAFPDALFGDYPSCMYNKPALFDIVAGRKTELWVMDSTELFDLYEEHAEIGRQGRLFMESAYNSLLRRYYAMYSQTPTERYLDLIHAHPQIEQDVPQKEIAEYLQITPVHLCRIRKELMKQ